MSTTIADFLIQTKVDIEAVQLSGSNAFHRVWIAPAVDVNTLLHVPRFPVAIINDGGGVLDPVNSKVWTRRMDVTVIDCVPRDHVGENSLDGVLDRGEALIAAMEWNRTDGLYLAADSDVSPVVAPNGLVFIRKTYSFEYQLQRA